MNKKMLIAILFVMSVGIGVKLALRQSPPPTTQAKTVPDYDKYIYGKSDEAKVVDIATQPNAIFTSESLFHDRILQKQLAAEGWTLREHPYRNGKEMIPYTDGRLDVMILGDIPVFMAMNQHRIGIFALCRQGYNTIVANRKITPNQLKGLRVGYPTGTTAHFSLDRTLQAASLTIDDITSVPMPPDQMEAAFRANKIDAIVSWEPTASAILAIPGSAMVSSSQGFSYIAMDLGFVTRHPRIQQAILAAIVRAVNWAKQDEKNIRTSLHWDRDAAINFFGKSPVEDNDQWIGLMRKETIDNPSFPMLPINFIVERGVQYQQFEFLKKIGSLPATADWKKIINSVDTGLLPKVIADRNWHTDRFDYAPDKLYQSRQVAP